MNKQISAWSYGPRLISGLAPDRFYINLGDGPLELTREPDGSLKPYLRYVPPQYQVIGISDCHKFALIKARDTRTSAVRVMIQDRAIKIHDGNLVIKEEDDFITILGEYGRTERIPL